MKNVAFKLVNNCFLTVHGRNPPTDAEFAPFLAQFRTFDLDRLRVISYSMGGAPTPAQRKQVNDVLRGHEYPVAIITEAKFVRGIITAMSWFNRNQRAFAPDELEDAFRHVGIAPNMFEFYLGELQKLRDEIERPEPVPTGSRHMSTAGRGR